MTRGVYPRLSIRERFERFTDKSGDCWEWTGARSAFGYGMFTYMEGGHQRTVRAHRVALEMSGIPIPEGQQACHRCDNPPCVRPSHLFAGTSADNTADMVAKGRKWTPSSEDHHWARLTVEQVRAIRSRGGSPQHVLAAEFGVSQTTISRILAGATWRSVA